MTDPAKDEKFNVTIENTMKLARKLEVYQWTEEIDYFGGGRKTLKKQWSSRVINDDDFDF